MTKPIPIARNALKAFRLNIQTTLLDPIESVNLCVTAVTDWVTREELFRMDGWTTLFVGVVVPEIVDHNCSIRVNT